METTDSVPTQADTVIVGAGIVGCNLAYQLTQLGREDVVVVDQGPMPTTGGSSTHAPGIMFQTAEPKELSQFADYSRKVYSELEGADGEQAYEEVGGIEVARSEERWSCTRGPPQPPDRCAELTAHRRMCGSIPLLGGHHGDCPVPSDGDEWMRRACRRRRGAHECAGIHGFT